MYIISKLCISLAHPKVTWIDGMFQWGNAKMVKKKKKQSLEGEYNCLLWGCRFNVYFASPSVIFCEFSGVHFFFISAY